jgi:hypothetical protein
MTQSANRANYSVFLDSLPDDIVIIPTEETTDE